MSSLGNGHWGNGKIDPDTGLCADTEYRLLDPEGCGFHSISAAEALDALADAPVLILGDSLSRRLHNTIYSIATGTPFSKVQGLGGHNEHTWDEKVLGGRHRLLIKFVWKPHAAAVANYVASAKLLQWAKRVGLQRGVVIVNPVGLHDLGEEGRATTPTDAQLEASINKVFASLVALSEALRLRLPPAATAATAAVAEPSTVSNTPVRVLIRLTSATGNTHISNGVVSAWNDRLRRAILANEDFRTRFVILDDFTPTCFCGQGNQSRAERSCFQAAKPPEPHWASWQLQTAAGGGQPVLAICDHPAHLNHFCDVGREALAQIALNAIKFTARPHRRGRRRTRRRRRD